MKETVTGLIAGLAAVVGFIVLLVVFSFLFAFPTMWLTNYLFGSIFLQFVFGAAKITIWQAWAANILFGTATYKSKKN